MPDVQVSSVRFEHHRAALGIGERAPRLSWRAVCAPDGWQQAGYEVEIEAERSRVHAGIGACAVAGPAAAIP